MSFTFHEAIGRISAELPDTACRFILSLGSGSGNYANKINPFILTHFPNPTIILAIDDRFSQEHHRSQFIRTLNYPNSSNVYFIHELVPDKKDKTMDLRLRTTIYNGRESILFGFSDNCRPRDDYPLLPIIPILQKILDKGGDIIVHNEIYFYRNGVGIEHNDSYYKWTPKFNKLPNIYSNGRIISWEKGYGKAIENEHMQDLCEIPYIMRQLRPTEKVLYLERGFLRPFLLNEDDKFYENSSGYTERSSLYETYSRNLMARYGSFKPINFERLNIHAMRMKSPADMYRIINRVMVDRDLRSLIYLIRFTGINRRFEDGWGYLHFAAYSNFEEGVEYLLDHGANVNILTDAGQTPLDILNIHSRIHELDKKIIRDILINAAIRGAAAGGGGAGAAAEGGGGGGAGAAAEGGGGGGAGAAAEGGGGGGAGAAAEGGGGGGGLNGGAYKSRRRSKKNKRRTLKRKLK
jgi:hypothetical protein